MSKSLKEITSKDNPRIKLFKSLLDKKGRKETGLFAIEGDREVARAIKAGVQLEFCLIKHNTQNHENYPCESFYVQNNLFDKISIRENSSNVIAVAKIWNSSTKFEIKSSGLYILTEKLEKPGNLGALIRSADAAGVDGFFIAEPLVDVLNHNVIRASQGAVFSVPILSATNDQILSLIKNANITPLATSPAANNSFWNCNMSSGIVICIGNEKHGLSQFWLNNSSKINIPMFGNSADSLNAQIAGTLCLYEARRQRFLKENFL